MYFGSMNVILLHSDYRHVSATQLAIFRVVSCKNTNIFNLFRDHSTVKCGVCSGPDTL
jgi:hypothetical protein